MTHSGTPSDKLLSVDELADALGVSRSTVYRLLKAEQLPHFRIGNHLRFDLKEVKNALRAQKRGGE